MSANRHTRDEIINRGLDLADSAALDQHDRPAGVVDSGAFSINWLQDVIDMFAKEFPFSATISPTPDTVTFSAGASTFSAPSLMIKDYRNGILLANNAGRLQRKSLDVLLNVRTGSGARGKPLIYALAGSTFHFRPEADVEYTGTLWSYKLPSVLASSTVPDFPDESILVDYIWLKAQEWHRLVQAGTAYNFARDQIKKLIAAGVGNEAEPDDIPYDSDFAGPFDQDPNAWMGKVGQ